MYSRNNMSQKALTVSQLAHNHMLYYKANAVSRAKEAEDTERREREELYERELAIVTQKIQDAQFRGVTSFDLDFMPCRKLYDQLLVYYDSATSLARAPPVWTFMLKAGMEAAHN